MATIDLAIDTPAWARPLLEPARYKGASGGRASGKSHHFAECAVEAMVCNPDLRFVCIREVQRSLKFSAKSLVESKIRKLAVTDQFDVTEREIRHRYGRGVMIFEGMQDHTADSIKSLEGFGRAWVEEAQNISERSMSLLLPTIRTEGSEIWFSWNPESPNDPVDAFFASKPDGAIHVQTTYAQNPFCPAVMHAEAARLRAADPDAYEHVWEGGYFLGGHGRVYSSFRNKPFPDGNIDESVDDTGGELYVGQDFNVNPMASVIAVRAVDECHVLDSMELKTSNTDEVAEEIRRRYGNRKIVFCPDPAGNHRSTSAPAGQTDFTILERWGFEVRAPSRHPPLVDRINNTQAMLLQDGRRRVRIHPRAVALRSGLANLVYKEGQSKPEDGPFGHICAALGYLLWEEFNVLASDRAVVGRFRS